MQAGAGEKQDRLRCATDVTGFIQEQEIPQSPFWAPKPPKIALSQVMMIPKPGNYQEDEK